MGFRPSPNLRQQLEQAARSNHRSLSTEIESRLERSFVESNIRAEIGGTSETYNLMRLMAAAIGVAESFNGKKWQVDRTTNDQVRTLIEKVFDIPTLGTEVSSSLGTEVSRNQSVMNAIVRFGAEIARTSTNYRDNTHAVNFTEVAASLAVPQMREDEWIEIYRKFSKSK